MQFFEVPFRKFADLPINPVQFTANMGVNGKQQLQHRPQQMPITAQLSDAALELPGDRAREDQAAFFQHGAHLVRQNTADGHQARPGHQD